MMNFPHKWWLSFLVIAGTIGCLIYIFKADDVFPSASIDLTLPKSKITELANQWAKECGYDTSKSKIATVFDFDSESKTFLEYELGAKVANQLMRDKLPVWYWATRMTQPLEIERFLCQISPQGKLVAFSLTLPNDKKLPSISHEDALVLAKSFIETKAQIPLQAFTLKKEGTVTQLKRTDHFFTFEDKNEIHGAHLRIHINIVGNKVGTFDSYLYVPQSWERKFSKMRSYNEALTEIASVFYSILNVGTFFAFVWAFTKGLVRFRFALAAAAFVAVFGLAEAANSLTKAIYDYGPSSSFDGYLMDYAVGAATSAFGTFLQAFMLIAAGEALYRRAFGDKIALEKYFSKKAMALKQTLAGLIAGYGLCGLHLGWIIVYYLWGRNVGFWSPLDVQNTESLSSFVPAFSAANIGVGAAYAEEFTYRILALVLLNRVCKNFYLANLLQAAAWAFMHSNYPQEPAYARGLELTVVGFTYGLVLQVFGLIPCLISHYVFDTFLGVTPLLSASMPWLQMQAWVVIAPFAILLVAGLIIAKKNQRQKVIVDEAEYLNSTIPADHEFMHIAEILPQSHFSYEGLKARTRHVLALALIALCSLQFLYFPDFVGSNVRLHISRDQAIAKAKTHLLENNLSLDGRSEAAWLISDIDGQELQYIFEKDRPRLKELADKVYSGLVWKVRFVRELDPNVYSVLINADGTVRSLVVSLAEETPGKTLKRKQAIQKAGSYLEKEKVAILPIKLKDVQAQERPNRVDFSLSYDSSTLKAAEAEFESSVAILGDIVCNFSDGWHLPDAWIWERTKQTLKDHIARYAHIALNLLAVLAAIIWLRGMARSGPIHWRQAILIAVPVTLTLLPKMINDLPEFFSNYQVTTPMSIFLVGEAVRQLLLTVSWLSITAACAAFALACFHIISPTVPIAGVLKAAMIDVDACHTKQKMWVDALLAGYVFGIGTQALDILRQLIHNHVSPAVTIAPVESMCRLVNVYSPSFDVIVDACVYGLFSVIGAAFAVGLYFRFLGNFKVFLIVALVVSLIPFASERYWQDWLINSGFSFGGLIVLYFFIRDFAGKNVLAYFFMGAASTIAWALRNLIAFGPKLYLEDITILSFVLLSPLIYICLRRLIR